MAGEGHYHYVWLTYSIVVCAESDEFAYLWRCAVCGQLWVCLLIAMYCVRRVMCLLTYDWPGTSSLWLTYSNVLCTESDVFAYLWLARDFFLPVRILANMSLEQEGRRYIWNNCVLYIPVKNMYLMHLVSTGNLDMVYISPIYLMQSFLVSNWLTYVLFTPAVQMFCIHMLYKCPQYTWLIYLLNSLHVNIYCYMLPFFFFTNDLYTTAYTNFL